MLNPGMGGRYRPRHRQSYISRAISMGAIPAWQLLPIGVISLFPDAMAHPVNILMIAPAGYRFKDFFRVGWPLTILSFLALLAGMKIFWNL